MSRQPSHYFSTENVSMEEWIQDNEDRLSHLYNYIHDYSGGVVVKIMDKCTFNDFCEFMFHKSTCYERNLRYIYTSNE